PGSPIVARLRCGDPVTVIDPLFSSFQVRTLDGKEGYILGLNLGQWSIDTEAAGPTATAAIPSSSPSSATSPSVLTRTQTPALDAILASAPEPAPDSVSQPAPLLTADLIPARASAPASSADLISTPALKPVPLPPTADLVPLPAPASILAPTADTGPPPKPPAPAPASPQHADLVALPAPGPA